MDTDLRDLLLEESPDALIATTAEGRVLFWSKGAERTFGHASAAAVGQSVSDLIVPREHRMEERRMVDEALQSGFCACECVRARSDGSRVHVVASYRVVADAHAGGDLVIRAEKDVTDLHELQAANSDLEAFDYSVAHDLRAPLDRIAGFVRLLRDESGDKLDAGGREVLGRVLAAVSSMDELVADLLKLSTVARGRLARTSVDVSALAESIVAGLCKSDPQRNVHFSAPPAMKARADPGLLRVLLENLIGNAWKFTAAVESARIEMGCIDGGGQRIFFVRDNGVGFDVAVGQEIFKPFRRVHSQNAFEGKGIGLATVRRIVRRHGGRVWAEPGVDGGAAFFFTLDAA